MWKWVSLLFQLHLAAGVTNEKCTLHKLVISKHLKTFLKVESVGLPVLRSYLFIEQSSFYVIIAGGSMAGVSDDDPRLS